jgi:hypothetical protein
MPWSFVEISVKCERALMMRESRHGPRKAKSRFRLFPDPGPLPTKPKPGRGQKILLRVPGLPPCKDVSFSIRNIKHRHNKRFMQLRREAVKAMGGRSWSSGAIELRFTLFAPCLEKGRDLLDYLSGVLDTLDGSHGFTFTYLPTAFQDDCQVCAVRSRFRRNKRAYYRVEIIFLE